MRTRLLICDDSAFFRNRLSSLLSQSGEIEVIGTAEHGAAAVEMACSLKPDVITMDYEMPVMDGISAVRQIMIRQPTPILMFSSLTYEGARVTLDALEAGAVDFLPKSFEDLTSNQEKLSRLLITRIVGLARRSNSALQQPRLNADGAAASARQPSSPISPVPNKSAQNSVRLPAVSRSVSKAATGSHKPSAPLPVGHDDGSGKHNIKLSGGTLDRATFDRARRASAVLIGTSTGGPIALQKVVSSLRPGFSRPVVLIQHMPASFTPAFAERLNSLSQLDVSQMKDGEQLRPGHVYIAPGGKQTFLERSSGHVVGRIIDGDERLHYKPCIDITFGSAAKAWDGSVLGIILTGMGQDGRDGCRILKERGAVIMTQDEASCVIYGMPQAVDKAGLSDCSLDLLKFPVLLNQLFAG